MLGAPPLLGHGKKAPNHLPHGQGPARQNGQRLSSTQVLAPRSTKLAMFLTLSLCSCALPAADELDAGITTDSGEPADDAGQPGDTDAGNFFDAGEVDAGPPPPPPPPRCRALDGGVRDDGFPDGGLSLRIMAANLTSGNFQSYDPGHGTRILQGLKPDVVLLNEFKYGNNSEADLRAFVDLAFGPEYCFAREVGAIPNGVVSRYPIVAEGEWDDPKVDDRDFAWARIDLPGDRDLFAVSLHLLTSSAATRSEETTTLLSFLTQALGADDLLVVGGDLNTDSRTESTLVKLGAVVVTAGPHPADQSGNGNTNASRTKPYDWVLVSPALSAFQTPVELAGDSFDAGLVFDSRTFSPLSAVPPVLSTDSAATNMQHMGVVKDFHLP